MEHKPKPGKENIRPADDNIIKKSSKKRSLAEMQAQHSDQEEERPRPPMKKFRSNNYRSETPPEFQSTPSSEDSIAEQMGSLSLVMDEAAENKRNQQ